MGRARVLGASWLATVLVTGMTVVAQDGASITVETIRQRLSDSSASARRTFILSLADVGDEDLTDPARTFATGDCSSCTGRIAEALQRLSPDDDGPRTMMTWYEAAMYCNWLSRQSGLPESEWVYPTGFHEIAGGMVLPDDHLHRLGYRLPTEAEWEYAARAGAGTARFYGECSSVPAGAAPSTREPGRTACSVTPPARSFSEVTGADVWRS